MSRAASWVRGLRSRKQRQSRNAVRRQFQFESLEDRRLLFAPGDIAVVEFNVDAPDRVGFVALVDLPASSEIQITDNEWNGATFNDLNEGELTWTSPAGGVTAGTVVTITDLGGSNTPSHGTVVGSNLNLGGSNEAVYFVRNGQHEPGADGLSLCLRTQQRSRVDEYWVGGRINGI